MKKLMNPTQKYCLPLILLFFFSLSLSAQNHSNQQLLQTQNKGVNRSLQNGLEFPDFPPLQLSQASRSLVLPVVVDNSILPFMRPVFNQQGASCEQSTIVGYNFCYEINRQRQLASDTSTNLYPSHFAWNFMNDTKPYYGAGVNYIHTFDLLFDAGTPNEALFGSIEFDDPYYWMSGYTGYYQAMQNRISGARSINISTAEGINNLKHWLHNHGEGSAIGGLASFQAGLYYSGKPLPEGTPEAGKIIFTLFGDQATHGMTIVGYNDSIRFDLNNDGIYTNNIDINGDGIIDVKDWEIGGARFVNTYGDNWGNAGYAYVLYSTLATKYGEGGIWNNTVHVLFPDSVYQPELTIKATINYNKRERIRLRAGIATDTARQFPEKSLSFSIFNFQGGDFPMGGKDRNPALELGLDISPLLSEVAPETPFRVFLMIDENDPHSKGNGTVQQFAVLQYENGNLTTETASSEIPIAILDNSTTVTSVIVQHSHQAMNIEPENTVFVLNETDTLIQFSANGGTAAYNWQLNQIWHENNSQTPYNPSGNIALQPNDNSVGYAAVPLPFSFPFGNKTYDSVFMHVNGYLMFERQDTPYYLLFDELYLRQIKAIAGYMNYKLGLHNTDDYLSYTAYSDRIVFYWQISAEESDLEVQFSTTLHADGRVDFQYGNIAPDHPFLPIIGLSNGSRESSIFSQNSNSIPPVGQKISFIPELPITGISMTQNGELQLANPENISGSVLLTVTDSRRINKSTKLLFTNGLSVEIDLIYPSELLSLGEAHPLKLKLTNHSQETILVSDLSVTTETQHASVIAKTISPIYFAPGASGLIYRSFELLVSEAANPDLPVLIKLLATVNGQQQWFYQQFHPAVVKLELTPALVMDQQNQQLDPGEETDLVFQLYNSGLASSGKLSVEAFLDDPYAAITTSDSLVTAPVKGLSIQKFSFGIKVNETTPNGRLVNFKVRISDENGLILEQTTQLSIGKTPILLIDKDGNRNSLPHLALALREMNIQYNYLQNIDSNLLQYDQVFLALGFLPSNHNLRHNEDTLLVNYLQDGGNLYLEGGSFFKYDQPRWLRDFLRTQGAFDAVQSETPADTITGIISGIMQGLSFYYDGDQTLGENLIPLKPAVALFDDESTGLNFMTAIDSGNYKAISTSLEFGGLFPANTMSSKRELVRRYLSFFGYEQLPLAAQFKANKRTICAGESVSFSFSGMGNPDTYSWSFDGGNPENSNIQNPVVQFDIPGKYGVELLVKQGVKTNNFALDDFIEVSSCTGTIEQSVSDFTIFPNPATDKIQLNRAANDSEKSLVQIVDLSGRIVVESSFPEGAKRLQINIEQLPRGYYLVRLSGKSAKQTTKLIVY
ncbi:MAG: T9SS type A sorting domain-containing protein [Bacteroidales bacterium]|nr:T9SS type A sorting domain-containing protein [Bacteroidales bacterium]